MANPAIPITIDLSTPVAELPAYLTLPEAAAYMRRTTRCLARWEGKGLLRVTRPANGFPLVASSELARLCREGER